MKKILTLAGCISIISLFTYVVFLMGHGVWRVRGRIFAECNTTTYYYRGSWFNDTVHVWERETNYNTTFIGSSGNVTQVNIAEQDSFDRFQECELSPEVQLIY